MSTQRVKPRKSKPLSGKIVLVTRAREQAEGLSSLLRAQGARGVEVPLLEIRPPRSWKKLDAALQSLERYRWLILTSVNGVEAFVGRMRRLGLPGSALAQLKIAAIGSATRAAIEANGLHVTIT